MRSPRATLAAFFVIAWAGGGVASAGQSTPPNLQTGDTRLDSIDRVLRDLRAQKSQATPQQRAIQPPSQSTAFSFEQPVTAQPLVPDILGTGAVVSNGPSRLIERWRRVRDSGRFSSQLFAMVAPFRNLPALRQLEAVQRAVNRIPYRVDPVLWKQADYWATADETLRRGGGDCEDLAIVKLQALRLLGFPDHALYLSVGSAPSGDHAVLLVRLGHIWWTLDDRLAMAVPAHQLKLFKPRISFAADSAFVHGRKVAIQTTP